MLYLPLAHNFGRLMHLTGPYVGYTIAFLPDPLQTAAALGDGAADRAAERAARLREDPHGHRRRDRRDDGSQASAGRLVARRRSRGRQARGGGLPVGGLLRAEAPGLADRLVFAKIRARLGGRLRTPISGGAPLAQEIAEFFDAIGIRILEGYGLTECTTAATTNTPERWRFGTVGPALPGFELRLADDGELLIRSDTVFGGYYKDPEATAEVLGADGWLRSGDIAEIDEDGFVKITDRKKDIIVTAGGKNIAPQNLENDLKASKYISQALVVGDRRPYPAALVTLDAGRDREVGRAGKGIRATWRRWRPTHAVIALVQGIVDDVNRERSRFEQIKRFAILPRDFTMERRRGDTDAEAEAARDHGALRRHGRRAVRRVRAPRLVRGDRSARGGERRRSRRAR